MNDTTILFWGIAALLTLIALAIILPSLIRKPRLIQEASDDQNILIARERLEELKAEYAAGGMSEAVYQQTYQELERAILNDISAKTEADSKPGTGRARGLAVIVAILLPVMAIGIYSQLGTSVSDLERAIQEQATREHNLKTIASMVEQLAERLRNEPDNLQGWIMLGRSYMAVQRYPDAVKAFERAHSLDKQNPNLMLQYADALVMSRDGDFSGQASTLINEALALRPNDITALWLAGMAANQQGDYQQALTHWNKLLPMLQQDQQALSQVQAMIAQTQQQLSQNGPSANTTPGKTEDTTKAAIQVTVSLDPALADKVSATDTVFIYAKATNGPPMPLAVARHQVKDLPLTVTLDDSMAMMPAMQLSNFPQVNVGARISKTGQAIAQSGDYYNEVANIDVAGKKPLTIVIDQQKP